MGEHDRHDFQAIEAKWQKRWEETEPFRALDDTSLPKFYALIEFPYPSGDGLHVGHPRSYTAMDIIARKRRMAGFNVLYPIGWDAFGLPTENYALQTGEHPQRVTARNIERFRSQLKRLGFSFDWSREINTTDPSYYKWTQWIFLQLFNKGLAYKAEVPVNWCTQCKVGLANEEVVGGVCERCGGQVVQRVRSQWMLKITAYAERLIDDLDQVNFLEKIKTQQINWIGKSHGAEIAFPISGRDETIEVYTTRPDTVFGATYMVLAPEHPLVRKLMDSVTNPDEIRAYVEAAAHKSEIERSDLSKEVSGVALKGVSAVNPANEQEIPIWLSDYVLISYGTGAIMAVPGHDERDWRFARRFGLPIVEVIAGGDIEHEAFTAIETGTVVNSDFLNGMSVKEAIAAITRHFEKRGLGRATVNYRLRDWVFSRQRYWGEPIPLVHCETCGWVPIPEDELPLVLPEVERYQTTDTGESPLALLVDWVNTKCPSCGGEARRETDTMPQWAGSSWYFLRYVDPHNDTEPAAREKLDYWLPVDWYNGGMEHTTLHLLYSRFWHKFLYDVGVVPTPEPYARRTSQGMILGENSEKMSKSRGNVVNPDELVETYGADSFRLYEMFMGDFSQATPWSTQGLIGTLRFLTRVWNLQAKVAADAPIGGEGGGEAGIERLVHRTVQKVGDDIEALKFNTAIAALMTLANGFGGAEKIATPHFETFVLLLAPFAPHLAEELWQRLGHPETLARHPWPRYDEELVKEEQIEVAVQVQGKVRARVQVPADIADDELAARAREAVAAQVAGKQIVKEIVVRHKKTRAPSLVNLVVK